jgi:hypothetical protein
MVRCHMEPPTTEGYRDRDIGPKPILAFYSLPMLGSQNQDYGAVVIPANGSLLALELGFPAKPETYLSILV